MASAAFVRIPNRSADIVLTNRRLAGRTLHQVKAALTGAERMGCFLTGITRQGLVLPLLPETVLRRLDQQDHRTIRQ